MLGMNCESIVGVKVLGRYCCKEFVGVLQHSHYPMRFPRCIKTLHDVTSALFKLIDCNVHLTQLLWCLKSPQSLGNAQVFDIITAVGISITSTPVSSPTSVNASPYSFILPDVCMAVLLPFNRSHLVVLQAPQESNIVIG